MRYRVRLWMLSIFGIALGKGAEVIETKYFRWLWMARLYELPYLFGPRIPGALCWTTRDAVVWTGSQWAELGRHSTQLVTTHHNTR